MQEIFLLSKCDVESVVLDILMAVEDILGGNQRPTVNLDFEGHLESIKWCF